MGYPQTETSHLSVNLNSHSRKDSNSFYADKLSDLRAKIQRIQNKHEMTLQERKKSTDSLLKQVARDGREHEVSQLAMA